MHPAYSVIFFTTASGAGYGLLALMGVLVATGDLLPSPWLGMIGLALAFGGITFGLLSSTFHLGHPERAWRAMSQWRSSWLSREGLAALATYVPAGLFAFGWLQFGGTDDWWVAFGPLAAAMSAVTVFCTAMIYAVLKPIKRWSNGWVPVVYLLLALMSGAVWLNALARWLDIADPNIAWLAVASIALAWIAKAGYWIYIDRTKSRSTAESATGLGALGKVRLLEAPHTEENYLMKEMGFRIARKHAQRLRWIAALLAFLAPLILCAAGMLAAGWIGFAVAFAAALSASAGILIERWLFFAEAKHTVTLYYGAATA